MLRVDRARERTGPQSKIHHKDKRGGKKSTLQTGDRKTRMMRVSRTVGCGAEWSEVVESKCWGLRLSKTILRNVQY